MVLAGCAAVPHKAYNKNENAQIKRIGLVTPAMSDKTQVWMAVHPGASFGLVGAAIAASDTNSKTNKVTTAVNALGYKPVDEMQTALVAALQKAGFEVQLVPVARPADKFAFLQAYPDTAGIDAYLDIYSASTGFMAAGASTPYRPTSWVGVQLVSASTKSVLFTDQILYNPFGATGESITLQAGMEFDKKDFDELLAQPDRVVAGMRVALQAVSAEVARQLR